jgi:hypothetical protein
MGPLHAHAVLPSPHNPPLESDRWWRDEIGEVKMIFSTFVPFCALGGRPHRLTNEAERSAQGNKRYHADSWGVCSV